MDAENIRMENNKFIIYHNEDVFAEFDNLKDACKHRDYYRRYDWNTKLIGEINPPNLNGETFLSREDLLKIANEKRKEKEAKEKEKEKEFQRIIKESSQTGEEFIKRLGDGSYRIVKRMVNKIVYFGRYTTLDKAIQARDYFKETGWNTEDRLLFTEMKDTQDPKSYFESNELF